MSFGRMTDKLHMYVLYITYNWVPKVFIRHHKWDTPVPTEVSPVLRPACTAWLSPETWLPSGRRRPRSGPLWSSLYQRRPPLREPPIHRMCPQLSFYLWGQHQPVDEILINWIRYCLKKAKAKTCTLWQHLHYNPSLLEQHVPKKCF